MRQKVEYAWSYLSQTMTEEVQSKMQNVSVSRKERKKLMQVMEERCKIKGDLSTQKMAKCLITTYEI